jgi:aryl-alcohol dehydrogenase-like predicted oxidoreductase
MNNYNKIILGTAQIGSSYGLNNETIFNFPAKANIIHQAFKIGIRTIDTAIAYEKSEEVLGQIGIKNWNIITKIPTFKNHQSEMRVWVKQEIESSMKRLRINNFEAVLFHNSDQIREHDKKDIYLEVKKIQDEGLINKIGFSIYNIEQAEYLIDNFDFQILQIPYNIFDRRFENITFLKKCKDKNIQIHVRSIFLQGLLLMDMNKIPIKFNKWNNLFQKWHNFLGENKINALDACLASVMYNDNFNKIIIGIDNINQLEEISLSIQNLKNLKIPEYLSSNDLNLVNPQKWCKI